jgi:hypothetical protein
MLMPNYFNSIYLNKEKIMKTYNFKKIILLSILLGSSQVSWAACTQTLSPGANVASAVSSVAAGSTICLNSGNYGSVSFTNIIKTSDVTVQSVSGNTASLSLKIYGSNHLKFQNLTIPGLDISGSTTKNITVSGSAFTGQALLSMNGNTNANIVIDGNTFDGITVCTNCYEGRLQIAGGTNPVGVTIKNNHFGGGGESDGIQYGAPGVVIGPGNIFEGLVQGNYGRHIDAIQGYGQSNSTITGNYFNNNTIYIGMYDGGSNETITNNVFGPSATNEQKLQLGAIQGLNFIHNTVKGSYVVAQGAKTGMPKNINAVYRNNIFVGTRIADTGDQPGCASGCVYEYNLFSSSSNARGTNTIIGIPTFIDGAFPSTMLGYPLTSSSLGYKAAKDGNDMGINMGVTSNVGTAPPTAPTNLRVSSLL